VLRSGRDVSKVNSVSCLRLLAKAGVTSYQRGTQAGNRADNTMPTRILREGIITSERVNSLSHESEIFYRRLMSVVDDYGRYHANANLLRSSCYPLCTDAYPTERVESMLQECSDQELVTVYEVDGKKYVQIENFGQQVRSKSKFPAPNGAKDERVQGKIYFIQSANSKRVKIGYTEWKVDARLATLQTGSAEKLDLLGWIPGTLTDERALHKQFESQAVGGEWFTVSDSILKLITCEQVISNRSQVRSESESESESESYAKSASLETHKVDSEVVEANIETIQDELSTLYERGEHDRWNYEEQRLLVEVCRRVNCLSELKELAKYRRANRQFFPKKVCSLLENWQGTLDAARSFKYQSQPKVPLPKVTQAPVVAVKSSDQIMRENAILKQCMEKESL
jgi:hypothetical protein